MPLRHTLSHLIGLVLGLGAAAAPAQTLDKLRRTEVFTIAHRESSLPFSYLDPAAKKPIGLAVELCERIAEAVRRELKLNRLRIDYLPVTPATRIDAIRQGKADIECGSTTDNHGRREQVGFSHHHFFAAVQFMTKLGGPANWTDLDGLAVAVTKGTSTIDTLKSHPMTSGLKIRLLEAKDHAEAFELLASGQVQAFALEDVLLASLRAASAQPKQYQLAGTRLTIEPYALMLRRGDSAFRALVNAELERLYRSGDYLKIYRRWFQSPIPPKQINLELEPSLLLREQIRKPSSVIPG